MGWCWDDDESQRPAFRDAIAELQLIKPNPTFGNSNFKLQEVF